MAKFDPFKNRHKFQDDVWGQIRLNDLERDVIDTPEFQRLFRTSQMGFVEFVYHTANHTRGAHSIGACRMSIRLMNRLVENTSELHHDHAEARPGLYADFEISQAERILIRLGALVHDISHVPLSHDLERKSHKIFYGLHDNNELRLRSWHGHYDKHDNYVENPALYRLICAEDSSVLARVLRHYSGPFWRQLQEDADKKRHHHIKPFVDSVKLAAESDWSPQKDLLQQLLFHLLIYEKPGEAERFEREVATSFDGNKKIEKWHLGPKSLSEAEIESWHNNWYQPFRHDIIGNTLSADLVDYLTRDPQRLGTQRRVDLHLLSHYALVNPKPAASLKRYRCAIDLHDYKRGTTRTFLLNDLFRLLDLRQDIHEKAVMHRVVQSANAMLARGLLLLGKGDMPGTDYRPSLIDVLGLGKNQHHALQSEDLFFNALLNISDQRNGVPTTDRRRLNEAHRIFEKLIERRVCRPLVIVSGDWAKEKFPLPLEPAANNSKGDDFKLRTLAAIADSAYYSPFLLFVCSCVEKYLQGVFDTDAEVCTYAQEMSTRSGADNLLKQAQVLVPSRVITWTVPYKQLYKDPAIVVALGEFVDQIDRVSASGDIHDESARKRIEVAIADADSKYETLWQLYVFISDGLYYSGILNKLLGALPSECLGDQTRHKHDNRLKNSQALLSVAFKAVSSNWKGLDQQVETTEAKKTLLETRMDAEAFKEVMGLWVALYREKTGWGKTWTTVDTKQYYHEYALDDKIEDKLKRPCRDTRYKFDQDAVTVWAEAGSIPNSDGYRLIEFLDACHIKEPALLSEGEFLELEELYKDKETSRRCDAALSNSQEDPTAIPKALKALWLGGFPWPDSVPSMEVYFPASRDEIKEWLKAESSILRPNVRRRLCEDLDPIINIIYWAIPKHRNAVFKDFQRRLNNEATLIWNDVRSGRIANALKRRWNHPDAKAYAESFDES